MKQSLCNNPNEATTLKTYLKLIRASDKIIAASHRHLSQHNLTGSQFAIMEALYHLGPLCQRELGQKLLKSRGNITTVLNNLEKRSLVKRHRNQHDKRFFSVTLTATGTDLLTKIFPEHVAEIVQNFNPLTPAEQHELARLCRKLGIT